MDETQQYRMKAIMDADGQVSVEMTCIALYCDATRAASITHIVTDGEEVSAITEALMALRDRYGASLERRALRAALQAETVAVNYGEWSEDEPA